MKINQGMILFAVLGLAIGGVVGFGMGDQNGKEVCIQKITEQVSGNNEYLEKSMPPGWECWENPNCLRELMGL